MNETEETKEAGKEEAKADTDTGDKPTGNTTIDQANAAAERLEKANKETAELVTRQENIEASRRLGGTSSAGLPNVDEKEETAEDYSKRALAGDLNTSKE